MSTTSINQHIKRVLRWLQLDEARISFGRPITSYFKVQRLIAGCIRGNPLFTDRYTTQQKSYLDIGCGPNTHPEFINLDYGWYPGVDLCWDITKGIPLSDSSIEGIYSEHCLEHISFLSIESILGECFRVLRPGGTLRIIVPDGEIYLTGYSDLLRHKEAQELPYSYRDSKDGLYSPIISVNRIFRDEGHEFIYDFDCLEKLLLKTGFGQILKLSFGHGRVPSLLLDSSSRRIESLYIEATKL
jgi:SAM-dependent methyltransferase